MDGVGVAMPFSMPLLDVPQGEQNQPHSISVGAPSPSPCLHPSLAMPINSNLTNRILSRSRYINAKHYHKSTTNGSFACASKFITAAAPFHSPFGPSTTAASPPPQGAFL